MADRIPFVDYGDEHDVLSAVDTLVDAASGLPFLTAADGGGLKYYATLALAIADGATLVAGQWVSIGGGDESATGFTNADEGLWQVNLDTPTLVSHFDKRLDVKDSAGEIELLDSNNWYGGQTTSVESALNQIGDKQVFYRLGDVSLEGLTVIGTNNSLNVDAIVSALIIDNGTQTDPNAVGDSVTSGIVPNRIDGTPATLHRIPIRDNTTQDAIDDGQNNEVYARLEHDAGDYVLKFYSRIAGVETAYVFPANQDIDLAYVLVSQDFMRLPANTGLSEAFFYGDQGGVSGTISDENVVTNSPVFAHLLSGGLLTQEAVNNRVDSLGSTANGEGASLIGIETITGLTATDVQAALSELYTNIVEAQAVRAYNTLADAQAAASAAGGAGNDWQIGDVIAITGPGVDSDERGLWQINNTAPNGTFVGDSALDYTKIVDVSHTASEVEFDNSITGQLVATDVQSAIDELTTSITNSVTTFDYTSVAAAVAAQGADAHKVGDYVIIFNNANHDEDGIYRVTALTAGAGDYLKVYDAFNAASEVSYDNGTSGATATNVQAAIDEVFAAIANANGHHDYANLAAAQAAADATWLVGDYVYILGDAGNEDERGVWQITGNNGTNPGDNGADYTLVMDVSHTAFEVAYDNGASGLTATNVKAALDELAASIAGSQGVHHYDTITLAIADQGNQLVDDYVIIAGTAPNQDERGIYNIATLTAAAGDYTKVLDISHTLSEVLITNGGGALFTGTNGQQAIEELLTAIGGASTIVRNYTSNNYVTDNDSLVVAIGKLDAAIAAAAVSYLSDATYVAAEAIAVDTGPKLVAMTSTASNVENANASDTGTNVEIAGFATGVAALSASDPVPEVISDGTLGGFAGLTPGSPYYADPSVEGGITATVPSAVGQWVVPVGVAKSATELIVRIGEPTEIVPASKSVQRNVWFKDTSNVVGDGMGESGFSVEVGDIWVDNDDTVQNPTKSSTGRSTVYVCIQAWTGAGVAMTAGNIDTYFKAIGKQN